MSAGDGQHGGARQRALALLREALAIVDDELGDDLAGARLAECIAALDPAEGTGARGRQCGFDPHDEGVSERGKAADRKPAPTDE